MVQVSAANLADDDVRSLITLHQRRMYDASPPGTSFALDLSGLEDAAVIVLEARDADALLGQAELPIGREEWHWLGPDPKRSDGQEKL